MNKKVSFVRETATIEKVVQLHKVALGQYFTPPTVVEFMYQMLLAIMPAKDRRNPRIIDPACGEGIFLKYVLDNKITIPHQIYGIDIDPTAETRWKELDLFGKINLYLQDGLLDTEDRKISTEHAEEIVGRFDIVIGNPPYGGMGIKNLNENKKLMDKIRKFELWGLAKIKNNEHPTFEFYYDSRYRNLTKEEIAKIERTPIEILFLERFIQLARPGKWIAIIVPDGILANTQLQYVRDWVLGKCNLKAVISLPRETFKFAGTTAKTSILFLQKRKKDEPLDRKMEVFMAVSEYVGVSDPEKNDLPEILEKFKKSSRHRPHSQNTKSQQPLIVDPTQRELTELRCSWHPDYWDPKYDELFRRMKKGKNKIIIIGDLEPFMTYGAILPGRKMPNLTRGVLYIAQEHLQFTGLDFSEGKIFVKEKSDWDPERCRLRVGDILFARSGVASVGRTEVFQKNIPATVSCFVDIVRQDRMNPYYIVVFMKSEFGRGQVKKLISGVGTVNLSFDHIKSIQIPVLPDSVQQKIESEYKKMSKYHNKAMEVKAKVIKEGKTNKEAEQDAEYQKNIQKAEKMLNDLICKTEEIIEGRRKDI